VFTRLSGPRSRPTTSQNLVAPGIELKTSGSVARKSDHYTTVVVSSNRIRKSNLKKKGGFKNYLRHSYIVHPTKCFIENTNTKRNFSFLKKNHLGYNVMHSIERKLIFLRNKSSSSSDMRSKPNKEPACSKPKPLFVGF
jgi:hypothetical protein